MVTRGSGLSMSMTSPSLTTSTASTPSPNDPTSSYLLPPHPLYPQLPSVMIASATSWTVAPILPPSQVHLLYTFPKIPTDFFSLLFDMDMLKHIESESNTYVAKELSK
ncbi:hypothetical protein PoB_004728600 [Plakobranchus ocellatus]|uniref:Uncharacterized protein n=1 Tax=Plakobranchus ocellatus TaxID=259542 RepID=A0AAV4BK45_9GAST|nr:hypothetical protein PoB_004728600 [Plakobranchus ocellatus]